MTHADYANISSKPSSTQSSWSLSGCLNTLRERVAAYFSANVSKHPLSAPLLKDTKLTEERIEIIDTTDNRSHTSPTTTSTSSSLSDEPFFLSSSSSRSNSPPIDKNMELQEFDEKSVAKELAIKIDEKVNLFSESPNSSDSSGSTDSIIDLDTNKVHSDETQKHQENPGILRATLNYGIEYAKKNPGKTIAAGVITGGACASGAGTIVSAYKGYGWLSLGLSTLTGGLIGAMAKFVQSGFEDAVIEGFSDPLMQPKDQTTYQKIKATVKLVSEDPITKGLFAGLSIGLMFTGSIESSLFKTAKQIYIAGSFLTGAAKAHALAKTQLEEKAIKTQKMFNSLIFLTLNALLISPIGSHKAVIGTFFFFAGAHSYDKLRAAYRNATGKELEFEEDDPVIIQHQRELERLFGGGKETAIHWGSKGALIGISLLSFFLSYYIPGVGKAARISELVNFYSVLTMGLVAGDTLECFLKAGLMRNARRNSSTQARILTFIANIKSALALPLAAWGNEIGRSEYTTFVEGVFGVLLLGTMGGIFFRQGSASWERERIQEERYAQLLQSVIIQEKEVTSVTTTKTIGCWEKTKDFIKKDPFSLLTLVGPIAGGLWKSFNLPSNQYYQTTLTFSLAPLWYAAITKFENTKAIKIPRHFFPLIFIVARSIGWNFADWEWLGITTAYLGNQLLISNFMVAQRQARLENTFPRTDDKTPSLQIHYAPEAGSSDDNDGHFLADFPLGVEIGLH